MSDGVGGQPHAQCWYSLVTLLRHMVVHVCTDDINSLQSAMQIFIGRHGKRYGQTRQERHAHLYLCLHLEYIGRMF